VGEGGKEENQIMNAALGIFWHRKSGLKESQVGFGGGGYLVSVCVGGG
jgi:hypothetical protein